MTYFAIFNEDGWPRGFFTPEVHGEDIPAEAIAITDEQWQELTEHSGFRKWENGSVVPYEPPPPAPVVPRSVAMWRARTIMKVTTWEGGTLFDAVQAAISGLEDPLQRATAEEALERGDIFDRDGVFVPMLTGIVGVSDEQLDDLMEQAAGLPA